MHAGQSVRFILVTAAILAFPACKKKSPPAGSSLTAAAPDEAALARASVMASLEKTELKLGLIKLTDCAPLVMAKELGYFDDEGLSVTLEAQANWKILLDRVLGGELDGAHMLAGQPLGATIGIGTKASVVTAFSMDLNGNGITVSNDVWRQMQENDQTLRGERPRHPISARSLVPVVKKLKAKGTPLKLGMVFPVSTHNYELRYWLAAAGIHPGFYTPEDTRGVVDADVLISVTPPPQMPATLEAGTIQGYCVGEPWNQQAVMKGIGVAVTTDYDIWKNNPEKVFGVTEEWATKHPKTHVAVTKALIRAGRWLDESTENRKKAAQILSRKEYVGADYDVIASSMTGTFLSQKTDRREMPDFNVFYRYHATYPYYSDAIWYLTQMRRWGQIADSKPDSWYHEVARKVYRPDIYQTAARALLSEGRIEKDEVPWDTDGYRPPTSEFIDGVRYDGRKPVEYLTRLKIGHKDQLAQN
jgi:nitrate/nitrite transport system substrate-binding protein